MNFVGFCAVCYIFSVSRVCKPEGSKGGDCMQVDVTNNTLFHSLHLSPGQKRLAAAMWRLWKRQRKSLDNKFNRVLLELIQSTPSEVFPPPALMHLLDQVSGAPSSGCEQRATGTNSTVNYAGVTPAPRGSAGAVYQHGSTACVQRVRQHVADASTVGGAVCHTTPPLGGTASISGACDGSDVPEITAMFPVMASERPLDSDAVSGVKLDVECGCNCANTCEGAEPSQFDMLNSGWEYSRAQNAIKALLTVQDGIGVFAADFLGALAMPGVLYCGAAADHSHNQHAVWHAHGRPAEGVRVLGCRAEEAGGSGAVRVLVERYLSKTSPGSRNRLASMHQMPALQQLPAAQLLSLEYYDTVGTIDRCALRDEARCATPRLSCHNRQFLNFSKPCKYALYVSCHGTMCTDKHGSSTSVPWLCDVQWDLFPCYLMMPVCVGTGLAPASQACMPTHTPQATIFTRGV